MSREKNTGGKVLVMWVGAFLESRIRQEKNDADRRVRVGKVGLESDIQPVHDRSTGISLAVW